LKQVKRIDSFKSNQLASKAGVKNQNTKSYNHPIIHSYKDLVDCMSAWMHDFPVPEVYSDFTNRFFILLL